MSSLMRRQPAWTLQNEMNQLLDRFLGTGSPWSEDATSGPAVLPPADVTESNADIVVTMELPGLDVKDVDISVQGDLLTVKGEKKQEVEKKDETSHRVERSFGTFTRSFRLPTSVVVDKVSADFKAGVLRVTLPKAESEKRHEVKIKVS